MSGEHASNVHKRFTSHSGRTMAKPNVATTKPSNDFKRAHDQSLVVHPRPVKARAQAGLKTASTMDIARGSSTHLKHHKPERAHTLMRTAVRKPAVSLRQQIKVRTPTDILAKVPQVVVAPKPSIAKIDTARLKRAEHIAHSTLVKRFAPAETAWFPQKATADATVAAAPAPAPKHPTPANQRSKDIFQRALTHADAHEQPAVQPTYKTKKTRQRSPAHHRVFGTAAASLAVLLLAGFFTYQNKTAITLRYANAKAGFNATLPNYKPSGFAVGPFKYSAGAVSVQYSKAGTSRNYTVSQTVSTLDSQSLLESKIAPNSTWYQTVNEAGRTIYIYGKGQAAWVDGGVLYQINGAGNLTGADLAKIAASV